MREEVEAVEGVLLGEIVGLTAGLGTVGVVVVVSVVGGGGVAGGLVSGRSR